MRAGFEIVLMCLFETNVLWLRLPEWDSCTSNVAYCWEFAGYSEEKSAMYLPLFQDTSQRTVSKVLFKDRAD